LGESSGYDYDVFISYASKDRAWAEKLTSDLEQRQVHKIFLDSRRLEPGAPWEPQLASNVSRSRHLVVLWSKSAAESDWVREETIRFKMIIDPDATGVVKDRRLFQILMQPQQSSTLTRYQAFASLKDANVGAGPDRMTPVENQCWNAIVGDIREAVIPPVPGTPWPVAVFATTREILQRKAPEPPSNFAGTFEEFLQTIGIPSYGDFTEQYGDKPESWKPFGAEVPVHQILDTLLQTVNQRLIAANSARSAPMRWQFVNLITTPFTRLEDEVQKLSTGPSLLIIDPLSLRIFPTMSDRYAQLRPCFENTSATILWLTPFPPYKPNIVLRDAVKYSAKPLIEGYYEPLPPRTSYAKCALNLSDDFDLSRMVMSVVAEMPMVSSVGAVSAVLSVGAKRP
jgi:hypothetical protein